MKILVNKSTIKKKLSENFFKIREIRNQKYEASFECNDKTYFEKTKGGNNPKIIDVTNNNQYLMKLIENGDKPYVIATEIYNQIDTKIIVKGLEKHDIKIKSSYNIRKWYYHSFRI